MSNNAINTTTTSSNKTRDSTVALVGALAGSLITSLVFLSINNNNNNTITGNNASTSATSNNVSFSDTPATREILSDNAETTATSISSTPAKQKNEQQQQQQLDSPSLQPTDCGVIAENNSKVIAGGENHNNTDFPASVKTKTIKTALSQLSLEEGGSSIGNSISNNNKPTYAEMAARSADNKVDDDDATSVSKDDQEPEKVDSSSHNNNKSEEQTSQNENNDNINADNGDSNVDDGNIDANNTGSDDEHKVGSDDTKVDKSNTAKDAIDSSVLPNGESESFEQVSPPHSSNGEDNDNIGSDYENNTFVDKSNSAEAASSNDSLDQIYLDYNGTTPVYKQVLDAMMPYFTQHYGNPSSSHFAGIEPKRAIDQARMSILKLMRLEEQNSDASSVIFTSCGTESNNMAIQMAIESYSKKGKKSPNIVTTNVEHPAILNYLNMLKSKGQIRVTEVPVQPDGRVRATDVIKAIRPATILVTVMLANNESGAVMPVKEIAEHCRSAKVLFHTDAAQGVGKLNMADIGNPDMVTIVGHKIGAPKGVACLYVRPGCLTEHGRKMHDRGVFFEGGGQEFGRRSGTENVPCIVALGKAAELANNEWEKNSKRMETMRDRLVKKLTAALDPASVKINGPESPTDRLPNTLSISLKNIRSAELLANIGDTVAATSGASCHSNDGVSSVLTAMKIPAGFSSGTLRLTCGPTTTEAQVDKAASCIVAAAEKLDQNITKK